jgi:hypothetical protein
MQLIGAAKKYIRNGISVIATGSDKRAISSWKKFQSQLPNETDLKDQFNSTRCKGIAVICGSVSGNLEVIDVDSKYDLTGTLFEELTAAIYEASKSLSDKLLFIQTKSGGYHIYYKCSKVEGNQKLAQRPASEQEIKDNPHEKVLVLIETRGEGGYVIAPPTEGYQKISGSEIPTITEDERDLLLEIYRSFNQLIIEQPKPFQVRAINDYRYALTPYEDYNNRGVEDMLNLLQKHGWTVVKQSSDKIIFKRPGNTESKSSGDYSTKHNLFTVFTTSSIFEPLKGYKPAAVYAYLEHNGDFKKAVKALAEKGYGEKPVNFGDKIEKKLFQKKMEGYTKDDLTKIVKTDLDKDDEEAKDIVDQLEKQWGEKICAFWDVQIDNENKKKININKSRFIQFLHEVGGFGLYFYDSNSTIYRIVRVKEGFVEESSTEQMKKFILTYINNLPDNFDKGTTPEVLQEMVIKQYASLFNEGFLEFLPHLELDFLKDGADKGYFAFKNGVVIICKDKIELTTYASINKVIWKNQVKDFNITIDQGFEPESCEYYRFIEKIAGDEEERLIYCVTLIGYLLHRYKDPAKPFAVVLAEETESDKDGGGTGKGIFIKAISELLKTVKVDGKNFKLDKNFSMQRVSLDTQLIAIEDCDKNLDFEKFNSQITEGSTVEKKNKDELFIDYKDSPKFIFTTNYTLNVKGNHGKRRSKIFEFSPFFGPENTPMQFFGHLLFEAWDEDEWNRFYNFLFFCLSGYLLGGIKEVGETLKMKKKKIKLAFTEEFLEWFEHYSKNGCSEWKPFKELYNNFMIENDLDKKDYSPKRFKKGLDVATETFEMELQTRRNRVQNNQHENRIVKKGDENLKVLDN